MSKIIGFFATRNDLLDLLTEVESARAVHYVEAGMFETPDIISYDSASQIPDLGLMHVHSRVLGRILLITDITTPFTNERVPQKRGGVRYAVNQKENPDTVSLHPGGQFDEQTILAGDFGTCTDSQVSASLLKLVGRVARMKWARIKGNSISPEALAILDAGGRLTDDLRAPREYDLRR